MEDIKRQFYELIENFQDDDLISYQLLISLFGKIFAENDLSVEDKNEIGKIINDFLKNKKLDKFLTIKDLNLLFDEKYDVNDINTYQILLNILKDEFNSEDEIISLKIQELIFNIISKIIEKLDNTNQIKEKKVNIDTQNYIQRNQNNNPKIENEDIFIPSFEEIKEEKIFGDPELFFENNFNNTEIEIKNKNYLTEYIRQKKLIPYQCKNCGLVEWQNAPLLLILDSIDGTFSNKKLENLRFLCPNCYSQIGR